ncbi:YfhD family protein [Thalassobacillus sp. CUG 92003]|uniref:YfhD family protein n=1 Tax=Thalassobacillus sp. CUG 92003 TaxID=2736641 RepID=UPI0015E6848B|nr:YfhD family protein [Thalassobacillus sp. CUG 92003]
MGRDDRRKANGKNDRKLAQTPERDKKVEGVDVEYAQEFADQDDVEAQERAKQADERAKK